MASRAISGRPGGGKSYYAVKLLLRELFETERPIVTNLPLRLDNILKYCLAHSRDDIDVYSRIQVLPDEDVPDFWRFRGNGIDPLPTCTNAQYKAGERPAFDLVKPGGVCYFLDEVHDFLNSRNWMKTGDGCLFYISKHRHLGDDVFWITQAIKNVDSQFRSVTQDFTYCRNYAKEKYRGFTKGKYFTATTYLEPLTWAQLHQNPDYQEQEKYTMEKPIGDCYYTSKQKLAADTGKSAKGINIKWVFVGIAVLLLVFCFLAWWGPRKAQDALVEDAKKKQSAIREAAQKMRAGPTATGDGSAPVVRAGAPLSTPNLQNAEIFNISVPLVSITSREVIEAYGADQAAVRVRPSPFGNSVTVTGNNWQNVSATADLVRQLDRDKPENIVLQAVILRTTKGKGSNLGVWGTLQEVVTGGGFGVGEFTFDPVAGILTLGSITAAQEVIQILGSADVSHYGFTVESRPMLSTSSGSEAWFTSGREVPVPVTTQGNVNSQTSVNYKKVLFSLGVRPSVLPDNRLALTINQTSDDIVSTAEVGGNPVPTIATQTLYTRIELQEGQVAIIGGIEVATKGDEKSGFPILGQVPPLSWIMGNRKKNEEKSEVLIAITAFRVPSGANPLPVKRAELVKKKISQNEKTGAAVSAQVKKKERKNVK